ncbi:MAG: hypothetical protein AAF098_00085 [Pseudomonadota bacterium]
MQYSLTDRLECVIPIISRSDGARWSASMELPQQVLALDTGDQIELVNAIDESLGELLRINARSDSPEHVENQVWLKISCSVWTSPIFGGGNRISVTFNWPSCWPQFDRFARKEVLESLRVMVGRTREAVSIVQ